METRHRRLATGPDVDGQPVTGGCGLDERVDGVVDVEQVAALLPRAVDDARTPADEALGEAPAANREEE